MLSIMSENKNLCTKVLFDELDCDSESGIVDLSSGAPGPDALAKCVTFFEEATEQKLRSKHTNGNLFQYGPNLGNSDYRDQLSKFLREEYKDEVKRQNLTLTCGATNGVWLAASALVPPGAVVFIEDPTYFIMPDIFSKDLQMKIIPVPVLNDGMDMNVLEKLVAEETGRSSWKPTDDKPFRGIIYTIPTFHNPTGICYTAACCRKLVQIARENDLLVLCDDVYNLLYYNGNEDPPVRLLKYDDPRDPDYKGHVISNGSFSKILGPGLRLGWIETATRITNRLENSGILNSSGSANNYTAGITATVLELGYQTKHLQYLRGKYKERMATMCSTLETCLPTGCSVSRPKGGYFIWVTLPPAFDSVTFLPWCRTKYKVDFIEGVHFSATHRFQNCLRLSISFSKKEQIVTGALRLCDAIKDFLGENGQNDPLR